MPAGTQPAEGERRAWAAPRVSRSLSRSPSCRPTPRLPVPWTQGLSLRSHVSPIQSPVQRGGAGAAAGGGTDGEGLTELPDTAGLRGPRGSSQAGCQPRAQGRVQGQACLGPQLLCGPAGGAVRGRRPRSRVQEPGRRRAGVCRREHLSQPSQQTLPPPPVCASSSLSLPAAEACCQSLPAERSVSCPDPVPGLLSCPRPPSCPQARLSRLGRAPAVSAETPVPCGQVGREGASWVGGRMEPGPISLSASSFVPTSCSVSHAPSLVLLDSAPTDI